MTWGRSLFRVSLRRSVFLVVALAALLTACGGGGSKSQPTEALPPCTPAPPGPSPAAGTIATIAGKCNNGSIANGIAALDAQLFTPSGIAADAAGNVYIGDYGSSTVRKITNDGKISIFAGTDAQSGFAGDGGPATDSQLDNPTSAALGVSGNLFIVDSGNNRVRKVTSDSTISTVAGSGQEGFAGDGDKATGARFNHLRGIAVDSAGNLYLVDSYNFVVRKVGVDGILTTVVGNGHEGSSGDGGPATGAELKDPVGVAIDGAGNIYVGDNGDCRIRKVTPAGVISTFAGVGENQFAGDGGPATAASLCPGALAVDAKGNVYAVDVPNLRVRKIAVDGTITTVAGNGSAGATGDGGPAVDARLNVDTDAAIAFDAGGNLYIADSNSNLIRKVFTP